jgi:hypothetical protein
MVERVPQHLDEQEQQKDRDGSGRDRFVLPMAVGMIDVRRLAGRMDADEADDVRRAVGERVEAVGQDADRAAGIAERDLRSRDGEVEEENADENRRDFGVALQPQTSRRLAPSGPATSAPALCR